MILVHFLERLPVQKIKLFFSPLPQIFAEYFFTPRIIAIFACKKKNLSSWRKGGVIGQTFFSTLSDLGSLPTTGDARYREKRLIESVDSDSDPVTGAITLSLPTF